MANQEGRGDKPMCRVLRALPRPPRWLLHGVCLGSSHSFTTSLLSMHCEGKPASHIPSLIKSTGDNRRKGSPLKFYLLLAIGHQGKLPHSFWSSWHRCCCRWQCTADLSHQQCWSPILRQAKKKADEKKLKASNVVAVLLVVDCTLPHYLGCLHHTKIHSTQISIILSNYLPIV